MTTISATEFKQNLGHYLDLALEEDVYIMKNNKLAFKLTVPAERKKAGGISQYFGSLPANTLSLEETRLERIMSKL